MVIRAGNTDMAGLYHGVIHQLATLVIVRMKALVSPELTDEMVTLTGRLSTVSWGHQSSW